MRTRLARTAFAAAVLGGVLTLSACGTSGTPDAQAQRNDAAQELAAARQAALVPLGTQLELLDRAELRAQLAGDQTRATDAATTIAGYRDLTTAIEAAPTPDAVQALVEQAGVGLTVATPTELG